MKNKMKNFFILVCLIVVLVLPYFVFAQAPMEGLEKVRPDSGYAAVDNNNNNLAANAGRIVNAFFSLLGMIFLILMLIAGYNWMTAAGDQGKVDKAKETIRRAIIGLIITVGAYAITEFVLVRLLQYNTGTF